MLKKVLPILLALSLLLTACGSQEPAPPTVSAVINTRIARTIWPPITG